MNGGEQNWADIRVTAVRSPSETDDGLRESENELPIDGVCSADDSAVKYGALNSAC